MNPAEAGRGWEAGRVDTRPPLPYRGPMSRVADKTGKIWTEAELQALPGDGYVHEVVRGEIVMSPKNNFQHEQICQRLNFALESHNRIHHLGAVFGSSMGFWMENHNCRAPDVAFVAKARLLQLGFKPDTKTFFPGAPDLAVEVLSPGNTRLEIEERLADFFASGSQLVWIIHPDEQFVEVCRSRTGRCIVGPSGSLEGGAILPGFSCQVKDLFKNWDWE
jgi:Uma2 family endonuclease